MTETTKNPSSRSKAESESESESGVKVRIKIKKDRSGSKLKSEEETGAPIVRVSLDGHQKPTGVNYSEQAAYRNLPSSQWNNVHLRDIGNFEVVPLPKTRQDRLREDAIRVFPSLNNGGGHPFIEGDSPFIYYVLTPTFKKTAVPTVKQPINIQNKLTKKEREAFTSKLDKSINKMALFWTDDLLPTTLALETALDKVEEFTQQAADVSANLSRETIKRRFQQVIDIRLLRFAADTIGITKEEHELLLQQLVQGPRPVQQFMIPVTQRNQ